MVAICCHPVVALFLCRYSHRGLGTGKQHLVTTWEWGMGGMGLGGGWELGGRMEGSLEPLTFHRALVARDVQ